ncbi:DUF916 and DUF3324 domain-containing protein [Lactiplantibacillus sp. WILCCON 0030]|uniref:DUF916 and DUF3324 domain-containing protein n=1 Tax=Lactiplantibacillus brownii TaxID=3069269 RepID=A0ABU1A601_9LACO|nr:DUF916 and DUF3324 domain-containing protein [Lactiplantibacillus brownii]MDQ7936353.1 DUF916 and DUF3324 domain-containing protein [Lactiplantibacillus brownii]
MKRWLIGILAGVSLIIGGVTAQAESNHFSAQAVLPDNQVDKDVSYFDLLVKPAQTQSVTVRINNGDTKAHEYDVHTYLAATSDDGHVIYNDTGKHPDQSLQYNLVRATTPVKTLTVAANKSVLVNLKIKVPAKKFPGVALGAIAVVQHVTTDKHKKVVSVQNQFGYTIGLQLRETAKLTVKPKLNLLAAGAKQVDYRNYITAKLQNSRAVMVHDLKVTGYVTKVGQSKQLLKTTKSKLAMAPNSHFNYNLGDGTKQLAAGNYVMHIKANSEKGKYHWTLSRPFTITRKTANKLNQTSAYKPEKTTNWTLVAILAGVIIILIGLLIWVLMKNRRRNS